MDLGILVPKLCLEVEVGSGLLDLKIMISIEGGQDSGLDLLDQVVHSGVAK